MFRAVAFVPSPPLLVPELTGAGVVGATEVRSAAVDAATFLAESADAWIVLGVDDHGARITPRLSGTFAGYGVDVDVALSPEPEDVAELPLPALIAGWLRGRAAPGLSADVVLVGRGTHASECLRIGRGLRAEFDTRSGDWGLLVVGDGATTLTEKAPGSFDERAAQVQRRIDDALATADLDALATLDRKLCADVGASAVAAWQTVAGVVGSDDLESRTLYRDAPFGVGYFVGTWSVVR